MEKKIIYKLFSYHFEKTILNKKNFVESIKKIDNKYDKEKLKILYSTLEKYKDNEEFIKLDDFAIKALKLNFNINKKTVLECIAIDDKIYRVFFEYLNEINDLNHSFYVLKRNQVDLLSKLDFLGYDYNLVIKKQTMTLQKIGDEYGYTRERIRQKINETKDFLKEYTYILKLNYIYYEDLKYLPYVKQAIIFSDEENNFFSVGMYVLNPKMKELITKITTDFKEMFLKEDENIEKLYEENSLIIKRYLEYDEGFYEIDNKIYTLYTEKGIDENKFLFNFLDENDKQEILLNKQFVEKFKKSLHGKLYIDKYDKSITQVSLKKMLSSKEVVKLSGDKYLYNQKLNQWAKEKRKSIKEKLKKNNPIEGKEKFDYIFKNEINEIGLDKFYYLMKRDNEKEFKITKYNVEKIRKKSQKN